ncbi:MAG: dTMP kinase [Verrucomicrobia bacterium]|nr:MAG: dTMP kinase [Verrucomicrobiota bacterium]
MPEKNKKNPNNHSKRGILISFEGSEGSGKTTQIRLLASHLEQNGREIVVTREPGGTAVGEEIRHLLKHAGSGSTIFPETELLLFAASRAQLVRELLIPALKENRIVLCDRFLDSTTVYQGAARQMSTTPVQIINTFAVGDLLPDLTIIIDVPASIGLERIRHRVSDLPDRMEQENIEFYERVREGYLLLARSLPERFFIVDGTQDVQTLEKQIRNEVQKRFL